MAFSYTSFAPTVVRLQSNAIDVYEEVKQSYRLQMSTRWMKCGHVREKWHGQSTRPPESDPSTHLSIPSRALTDMKFHRRPSLAKIKVEAVRALPSPGTVHLFPVQRDLRPLVGCENALVIKDSLTGPFNSSSQC